MTKASVLDFWRGSVSFSFSFGGVDLFNFHGKESRHHGTGWFPCSSNLQNILAARPRVCRLERSVHMHLYNCSSFPMIQAYVTWFSISNFFVPLLTLVFSYARICLAIWTNLGSQREVVVRLPQIQLPPDRNEQVVSAREYSICVGA